MSRCCNQYLLGLNHCSIFNKQDCLVLRMNLMFEIQSVCLMLMNYCHSCKCEWVLGCLKSKVHIKSARLPAYLPTCLPTCLPARLPPSGLLACILAEYCRWHLAGVFLGCQLHGTANGQLTAVIMRATVKSDSEEQQRKGPEI